MIKNSKIINIIFYFICPPYIIHIDCIIEMKERKKKNRNCFYGRKIKNAEVFTTFYTTIKKQLDR